MKILFFSYFYKGANFSGGPVYSVSALTERLVKRGYSVDVITSDFCRDIGDDVIHSYVDAGVKVHVMRSEPILPSWVPLKSNMLRKFPALKQWLSVNSKDYDVVIVRNTYFPQLGLISSSFSNARLYYYGAGELNPERVKIGFWKKYPYLKLIELPALKKFSGIISLTKGEERDYQCWKLSNPILKIPNGIDAFNVDVGKNKKVDIDKVVISFFGRIHPSKGIFDLLKALESIHSKNWYLQIAGSLEEPEKDEFYEALSRLPDDNVNYMGCLIAAEDKQKFLLESDVFVLPTAAEGMSIALLEAMVSGNLIVTTEGSNMAEIINNGCGYICEKNSNSVKNTLEDVLALTPSEIDSTKERSIKVAKENFLWDSIVEKFESEIIKI